MPHFWLHKGVQQVDRPALQISHHVTLSFVDMLMTKYTRSTVIINPSGGETSPRKFEQLPRKSSNMFGETIMTDLMKLLEIARDELELYNIGNHFNF